MNSISSTVITYLAATSLQILILGTAAILLTRTALIHNRPALAILRMVLFIPLLYPFSVGFFPSPLFTVEVSAPTIASSQTSQLNDFQYNDLSVFNDQNTEVPSTFFTNTAKSHSEIPSLLDTSFLSPPHANDSIEGRQSQENPIPATRMDWFEFSKILFILWIIGFSISVFRFLNALLAHRSIVRSSELVTNEETLQILNECSLFLRLKRIPALRISHYTNIPNLTGLIRPSILLPNHLVKPQNRDGLRFTILHELAHYKHKDSWWLILETLFGFIYFFHPITHLLRRQIEERRETLCDLDVIHATDQRSQYADFLLHQVWRSKNPYITICAIPIASRNSCIGKRIQTILKTTKTTMVSCIYNLASIILISILFISVLSLISDSNGRENQHNDLSFSTQPDESYIDTKPSYLIYSLKQNANLFTQKIQEDLFPNVHGQVMDAQIGEPIPDVAIAMLRPADTWDLPKDYINSDYTSNDGRYTLAPNRQGSYPMVALKQGYAPYYFTLEVPEPAIDSQGRLLFQKSPSPFQIRMKKTNTSIRALVRYKGEPYNEEIVSFSYYRDGIRHGLRITPVAGEKGTFILHGMEPGEGQIACRAGGHQNKKLYDRIAVRAESEKQIDVIFNLAPKTWYRIKLIPRDSGEIEQFEIKVPDRLNVEKGALCFSRFDHDQFSMELPSGNIQVSLKAPGYKRIDFDPCTEVNVYHENSLRELSDGAFILYLDSDPKKEESSIGGVVVGELAVPPVYEREFHYFKAVPLDSQSGLFHITPRFKKIAYVTLRTNKATDQSDARFLKEGVEWSFTPYTHQLQLHIPFNPNTQGLFVQGKIATPRIWKSQFPIRPGSEQIFTTAPIPFPMLQEQYRQRGIEMKIPDYAAIAVPWKVLPGVEEQGYYVSSLISSKLNPSASKVISETPANVTDNEPRFLSLEAVSRLIPSMTGCQVITDRLAIRGYDYEVNEKEGIIEFLREENNLPHIPYFIEYAYYPNPANLYEYKYKYDVIGDYSDIFLLKDKILGNKPQTIISNARTDRTPEPIAEPPLLTKANILRLNPEPTHDPCIYTMSYILQKETMYVFVISLDTHNAVKELIQGKDYDYDPNQSLIVLSKSNLLDRSRELLEIEAIPDYSAFVFQQLKPGDPLSITVQGEELKLGADYTVDYSIGRIQINDATRIAQGTRFRIEAGKQTLLSVR